MVPFSEHMGGIKTQEPKTQTQKQKTNKQKSKSPRAYLVGIEPLLPSRENPNNTSKDTTPPPERPIHQTSLPPVILSLASPSSISVRFRSRVLQSREESSMSLKKFALSCTSGVPSTAGNTPHLPSPSWQSSFQDSASRHRHGHRLSPARGRSPLAPAFAV
jgi:hypothetical protein